MRWLKRIGLGVGALVALAALALLLWEPLLLPLAAPAPDAAPARAYDVTIARDPWGVPHIDGKTDADVAYGLAYAHAEDDFATLQEVLAGVRGRSGAFLGEDGAKMDFATHLLAIWTTTNRDYDCVLAPDLRALLEAYAAGLNRFADKHPEEVRLRNLFPVTGRDIAAGFVLRSPFFYGLDRPLGALVEGKPVPRDAGPADERGSNAFAIAGRRSADGVTRLVSNSHQPWAGPVAWYEAVVHSGEGWDFAGALFPGAPYPLLGHNKTLGWTNTVNRPDLIDVYRLTLDDSGDNYRFDGKWLPLTRERIWLRVKAGPFVLPIPRTLYRSVHGPVIVNDSGAFAIRYAGIDDIRAVDAYYRLNKAATFAEWRAIMARQAIVGTNFVYADAEGHIAFIYNARFPKRAPGYDWKGVLPGDTSKTLWTSYEPFSAYPQVVDPASGWVANANNTPFIATAPADQLNPANYAATLGIETFVTNRARRYETLFAEIEGKPISREDLLRIKFDKGYAQAGPVKRWIDAVLAVDPAGDKGLADAQALLKTWDWAQDGKGRADALAALLLRGAGREIYRGEPLPPAKPILAESVAFLMQHYGRLDPPLASLLRVRRGTADEPILGGPDALRAFYSDKDDATGKLVGNNGDSFVMVVEWPKGGPVRSWSIQPWGAAATRPGSPHYSDQAKRFAAEEFKPVRVLDPALDRTAPRTRP